MKIPLGNQIIHKKKLYGPHQKFKLQVVHLSHSHFIILIVLVLLIQVYDRYFYHHQTLKQCHNQVEEVNVRKVQIAKYHQQKERLELNKHYDYFVSIIPIQLFKLLFLYQNYSCWTN